MDDPASKSLRRSWWSIAASIVPAVVAVLTAYPLMNIGACFSWLTAWIALGLAAWAILCARRDTSLWEARPRRSSLAAALCLATSLLLAFTVLNFVVLRITREVSKSIVTASSLHGIHSAIEIYADEHEANPPSPDALVAQGHVTWKAFLSGNDPTSSTASRDGMHLDYSSFVFTLPADRLVKDADVVLAYEREPWNLREPRVFSPRCLRWVLSADGQIRSLDPSSFEEALKKDTAKRKELGMTSTESPAQSQPAG